MPRDRMRPVFVDPSGRRRRLTVLAGMSAGIGLLISLALIAAGLFASSPASIPGWPSSGEQQRGGAEVGQAPATPTGSPGSPAVPARTVSRAPAAAPQPTSPPAPRQTAAAGQSGQGDVHRNPSPGSGRPSRAPGKPG